VRTAHLIVIATLLDSGCHDAPDDDLKPVTAKVADARGGYVVNVQVNGWQGVAKSVWIDLSTGQDRYITHQQCLTWHDQVVALNGVPLTQVAQGGPLFGLNNAPNGACQQGMWELVLDDLAPWRDQEQLTVQVSDASGVSEFQFENFVRTPVVTVKEPADGHVRPGGTFTIELNPSVDLLPTFTLMAAPTSTTLPTNWGNYAMSSVAVDHHTATIPVPAYAEAGLLTLHFSTGIHPDGLGFRGGVLQCSDAIACNVRRVTGGGFSLPEASLDDTAVTFQLSVDR
jgi:hypothetical protein